MISEAHVIYLVSRFRTIKKYSLSLLYGHCSHFYLFLRKKKAPKGIPFGNTDIRSKKKVRKVSKEWLENRTFMI